MKMILATPFAVPRLASPLPSSRWTNQDAFSLYQRRCCRSCTLPPPPFTTLQRAETPRADRSPRPERIRAPLPLDCARTASSSMPRGGRSRRAIELPIFIHVCSNRPVAALLATLTPRHISSFSVCSQSGGVLDPGLNCASCRLSFATPFRLLVLAEGTLSNCWRGSQIHIRKSNLYSTCTRDSSCDSAKLIVRADEAFDTGR